jgi:hypothetical protein
MQKRDWKLLLRAILISDGDKLKMVVSQIALNIEEKPTHGAAVKKVCKLTQV